MEDIVQQVMTVDEVEPIDTNETSKDDSSGSTEGSSWWSGWYATAVEKSSQALDSVKKDLEELSNVVQSESRSVMNSSVVSSSISAVSSTASYIKDTVSALVDEDQEPDEEIMTTSHSEETSSTSEGKAAVDVSKNKRGSLSQEQSFEEEVKEMLKIPEQLAVKAGETISSAFKVLFDVLSPTGYDDDDVVLLPGEQFISKDRWDLLVKAIQSDPHTYCHEPEGLPEDYESWLGTFKLLDKEPLMQRILETSPEVREFHETLVPQELSNDSFWHRYFYRLHQLKDMESKRAIILKERQQQEDSRQSNNTEVDIKVFGEENPRAKDSSQQTDQQRKAVKTGTTLESPADLESRASSSEESWEKTSMTESIVDEAAKKLAEKLTSVAHETKSDEELGEWELE